MHYFDPVQFGERVQKIRELRGMKQIDLAMQLGYASELKALEINLTNEEVIQLEAAYTPRIDVNVRNSDPKAIAQMAATVGIKIALPTDAK